MVIFGHLNGNFPEVQVGTMKIQYATWEHKKCSPLTSNLLSFSEKKL